MELLDAIHKEVLQQKEEEAVNFFSRMVDFRDFIMAAEPAADVSVTLKLCCFTSERLNGDHGTRVTLVNASQRALFNDTVDALETLTASKRKSYFAQLTVWDAKSKKGATGKAYMLFRPGAVYEFRQVDGVGFYADIAIGRV